MTTPPLPPTATSSAGKIHLLDLGALKERLGPKWQRMAEHVQHFFEAAIRRSLTPGDTYCAYEELTYLVVFPKLSAEEAEFKCNAISEEVCRRLFGENGESVSMRNLVAHVNLSAAPSGRTQMAALSQFLEREGKESVVSPRPANGAAPPSPVAINLLVSMGAGRSITRRVVLDETVFVYRPVWDLSNQVVLTYLCQPTAATLASNSAADFWTAEDEAQQTELDLYILRECVERADRLRAEGLRIVLAVPVHFATISRPRSWREYCAVLEKVCEETRRNFAFVIFGIDHGVPHVRLAQELPKISRMAYRVFCVAQRGEGAGARFSKSGATGLGLSLPMKDDERVSAMRVREIAKEARAAAVDAFVLGLQSTSLALMSIHSGVRYLEGPAVRPAVGDPRHAFAHEVADLYKAKLAAR